MASSKDIKLSPAVLRALADDKIRNDFMSFVIKVFETILPGEHLHLNWHIAAMAYQLAFGNYHSTPSSKVNRGLCGIDCLSFGTRPYLEDRLRQLQQRSCGKTCFGFPSDLGFGLVQAHFSDDEN
jgi:hypothetical protein